MNATAQGQIEVKRIFSYPETESFAYAQSSPFPHAIVDNGWDENLISDCKLEIGKFTAWQGQKEFYGAQRKRYCGNMDSLPAPIVRLIHEASSPSFLRWLTELTGEAALIPDPYLEGGGIHQILSGGFLKIHADFNWSERLKLYRRLNVLLYLNPDWNDDWGGALELWDKDMRACTRRISPQNNRMVVFTTDDKSFHGHPHPLTCPVGTVRDSIALYYYSAVRPTVNFSDKRVGTDYRPIDGDEFQSKKSVLPGLSSAS